MYAYVCIAIVHVDAYASVEMSFEEKEKKMPRAPRAGTGNVTCINIKYITLLGTG